MKYLGLTNCLMNQPNKPSPFKYTKQCPIEYLGLIDYLISQPNEPSPIKYPKTAPNKLPGLTLEAHNPKHITQSTRTPMQHRLGPFLSVPVLFTNPKENHIKPMNPKYAYNMIVGFKHIWNH
jgi:hypothetical protein